ncbi:MAG: tryptophan--tRNA ligase, partial [Saprospiraceae bacterium]
IKACDEQDTYDHLIENYHSGSLKYVDLKQATADALVKMTSVFLENRKALQTDKKRLKDQVRESSFEIRKVAHQTIREVKELVGLMNVSQI